MPKPAIQKLMKQIFQGLNFLHDKNLIHRNLKPDKILVSGWGKVKLTDFTLARLGTYSLVPYTPEETIERNQWGRKAIWLWYKAPELLMG